MDDQGRRRLRVARSAAALEVMLDNLGTSSNPRRGSAEKAAEMRDIIKAAAAEAKAEQGDVTPGSAGRRGLPVTENRSPGNRPDDHP